MQKLQAISEPRRAAIIEIIAQSGALSMGDIARHFDISNAAISQHLKVLKEAGLLNVAARGQQRIYSINPMAISDIENWAVNIKAKLESQIDRLEEFLASNKDLDS